MKIKELLEQWKVIIAIKNGEMVTFRSRNRQTPWVPVNCEHEIDFEKNNYHVFVHYSQTHAGHDDKIKAVCGVESYNWNICIDHVTCPECLAAIRRNKIVPIVHYGFKYMASKGSTIKAICGDESNSWTIFRNEITCPKCQDALPDGKPCGELEYGKK